MSNVIEITFILKSNFNEKTRKKPHNLTPNHAQIESINRSIKAFHSTLFERIFGVQVVNFPYSFIEILTARNCWERK